MLLMTSPRRWFRETGTTSRLFQQLHQGVDAGRFVDSRAGLQIDQRTRDREQFDEPARSARAPQPASSAAITSSAVLPVLDFRKRTSAIVNCPSWTNIQPPLISCSVAKPAHRNSR